MVVLLDLAGSLLNGELDKLWGEVQIGTLDLLGLRDEHEVFVAADVEVVQFQLACRS